jgi:hypothetical protein
MQFPLLLLLLLLLVRDDFCLDVPGHEFKSRPEKVFPLMFSAMDLLPCIWKELTCRNETTSLMMLTNDDRLTSSFLCMN